MSGIPDINQLSRRKRLITRMDMPSIERVSAVSPNQFTFPVYYTLALLRVFFPFFLRFLRKSVDSVELIHFNLLAALAGEPVRGLF